MQVSPHRTRRPWQGKVEKAAGEQRPDYDAGCYLCPGNTRAGGNVNPQYPRTFVFQNDFAALQPDVPSLQLEKDNLLKAGSEKGICRVVCFSPKHNLTLPEMSVEEIVEVVKVWTAEFEDLAAKNFINYIQIFENKGEIMGCSNPHPHCQIWAQESVPGEPLKESLHMKKYYQDNGKSILKDYLELELKEKERMVIENEHFVALVPFWAVWPFETMIISKRHFQDITMMNSWEQQAFASIIRQLTIKYDNLFETSFPYSAGLHQQPVDGQLHPEWHFHMHFFPPLLRSATVKKFMVGYEMLASPQRDITPESSAAKLRELSDVHYRAK